MGNRISLKKLSVFLVLGCGFSRGWVHIGAIEALKEEIIPFDFIVGCSVGGYVGVIDLQQGNIKSSQILKNIRKEHNYKIEEFQTQIINSSIYY